MAPETVLHITATQGALALPSPISARELASRCLDLCGVPARGYFESLSRFSADPEEKERLEYFGGEEASQNDDFQESHSTNHHYYHRLAPTLAILSCKPSSP
eukprot:TRINITY_DN9779_c0_g1_i2.p1 TRINITY_DN9779_c0_g1~~TRINITY_DN9779_c0_g1_i2.p1  ORF type:complete len:102 (-),score=9.02 TRINITY_DN9779_c0_g1_i2:494-799(-)